MGRTRRVLLAAGMALMIMGISGSNDTLAGQETDKTVSAYQRETAEKQNQNTDALAAETERMAVGNVSAENLLSDWEMLLGEEADLSSAQESLDQLLGKNEFSLSETICSLLKGEIPWSAENLKQILCNTLFGEMEEYRKMAVYLLVLIVVSALFSNFASVFAKDQITDISHYMVYLLMAALLMKVFVSMSQVAADAVEAVLIFMKLLLPACLMTMVLSAGSLSAAGVSQVTLFGITAVQWLMDRVLLPAVQIYVMLLFLNQLMKEDYLSKMADLIRTGILWGMKTVMALVLGLQAVQMMVAPAVDQLKNSVVNRAVSAIPGIGGAYEAVAETVLGSALLLKNAVGIAGAAALVLIGLIPTVKLAVGVLIYRFLGAAAQPVTDKRVAECIESVADGGELLMKIVINAGILFIISLAMMAVLVGR